MASFNIFLLERKLTEFFAPGKMETIFSRMIVSGIWVFIILDPLIFFVNSDNLIWDMFPRFISLLHGEMDNSDRHAKKKKGCT
ncbi:hypothetical protein LEP1GSC016_0332 [Leptospira borgpetersenii serovar Hardjo-bovis str. Sponselee]|uniref:Uncharacterized protein n=5 Tax=Leptospira borgpetersenii TaxID=174 RepID=M3GGK1_LEPBO|nr:hypothetical protein LEP1GSC128_3679 [Leptospira borgpetersenii str. 200801926]EKQ90998.1 hypothetical protein LEP1GSC101_0870 [Leptospira borgpetersenii str. UI 09149]EMG00097.1 hypothetical protein LEP1GSC123_2048 [Leptospira borgpetersenii str. 200701203]EMJ82147.1 hypothetical protein LEP1GSC016_0332 [Leptospira borgpetersenii serovar Hardjo-bovis str. Sponselee]EMK14694.1 hypothetical protein LEP1GSC066_3498 [Leptospira sp. serovar Kenya str. Sh9]EMN59197.1 hypothetical protein LEP1GSC